MEEVDKNTKKLEELKIENEKLKYDAYNQKMEISKLKNKLSESEYENKDLIDKKDNPKQ